MDVLHDRLGHLPGVREAMMADIEAEPPSLGTRLHEAAGLQKIMAALQPAARPVHLGQWCGRLIPGQHLLGGGRDDRRGLDGERRMRLVDVEEVDPVKLEIEVVVELRPRVHRQRETVANLPVGVGRLQARLVEALADG